MSRRGRPSSSCLAGASSLAGERFRCRGLEKGSFFLGEASPFTAKGCAMTRRALATSARMNQNVHRRHETGMMPLVERTPVAVLSSLLILASCLPPPSHGGPDAGGPDSGVYAIRQFNSTLSPGFFTYPGYARIGEVYSCPGAGAPGYNPLQFNLYLPELPAGQTAPLLLFFPGTYDDVSLDQLAKPGLPSDLTRRAAELGFAAAALSYYSHDGLIPLVYPDRLDAKSSCVFPSALSSSTSSIVTDNGVVAQLCGNLGPLADAGTRIDCGKGIVTVGHSQGSAMALIAKNYDARVVAAYAIAPWAASYTTNAGSNLLGAQLYCSMADPAVVTAQKGALGCSYPGFSGMMGSANYRLLTSQHVRAVAGDADSTFINPDGGAADPGVVAGALNNVLGLECPATPGTSCMGGNDAGWFLVGGDQLTPCTAGTACTATTTSHAGHCFFSSGNSLACANTSGLTESWLADPRYFQGNEAFGLDSTLLWLKGQLGP
jgi:hypothetical protein